MCHCVQKCPQWPQNDPIGSALLRPILILFILVACAAIGHCRPLKLIIMITVSYGVVVGCITGAVFAVVWIALLQNGFTRKAVLVGLMADTEYTLYENTNFYGIVNEHEVHSTKPLGEKKEFLRKLSQSDYNRKKIVLETVYDYGEKIVITY